MSKTLVTGGAGFIGSHLVERLLDAGRDVVVMDNFRRGSRAAIERGARARAVTVLDGDIRHVDSVRNAMKGCSTVFHLAAQSNVMGAMDDPEYSVTTNVHGTFNVLRCAVEAGVRRVVFTSSREIYGEARSLPVDEKQPLAAKNHYGASKIAGEAYCGSFASCHGIAVDVVRLANVYGAGDSGRVLPLWLTAAQEGRPLTVYGGAQVIDFLWVGTAVDALLHAERDGLDGPLNVGSGVGTSILELARRVLVVTGSKSELVKLPARDAEVARFVADTRRMRSLGLVPEEDPLQHLDELVAAYAPRRAG
jgi:UDP-glucose 4-epimerase